MPRKTESLEATVEKLMAENNRLRNRVARLENKPVVLPRQPRRGLRTFVFIIAVSLATAVLIAGNTLFWAGRTVLDTDRYMQVVGPLIEKEEIRTVVATRTTEALFENVDVEESIESALPARAAFLAPSLSRQVETFTEQQVNNVLASDQFRQVWYGVNQQAHERFIRFMEGYEGNGTIDVSDIYTSVSRNLGDSRLSFLANRQLPPRIGEIQLIDSKWVPITKNVIENFDTYRIAAIGTFLLLSLAIVGFAARKRRALLIMSSIYSVALFVLLIAIRLGSILVTNSVQASYQAAATEIWSTLTHPLVVQTKLLFGIAVLVAFVAWITGESRAARAAQERFSYVVSGKLHQAVVGQKQNGFVKWLSANRRLIEWIGVIAAGLILLVGSITPVKTAVTMVSLLLFVVAVEIVAGPADPAPKKLHSANKKTASKKKK